MDKMIAKSSVPAKNKPPTRNQQIMQAMQASIVAEKQQPKKEIKAKIVTNANLDQTHQVVSDRCKQDVGKRYQGKPPVSQFSRSDFATKTTLKRTESVLLKKPTYASAERPLRKVQTPIQKISAAVIKSPPKFHQPLQPEIVQVQKECDRKLLQQKMDYEAQLGNEKQKSAEEKQKFDEEKQKFVEEKQKFDEEKQVLVTNHISEIQGLTKQFENERKQFKLDAQQKFLEIEAELAECKESKKQLTTQHVILEERIRNVGGNKNLQAEVDSLKYELELKSHKINELKNENNRLTFVNNSILSKDAEIRKLQHRNQELSSDLSQQRDIHRVLTQQLENARIDGKNYKEGYESLLLDNESMRYRLNQAGHEIQTPSVLYTTAAQSPRFTSPSRLRIDSPSRRTTPGLYRTKSTSAIAVGNATTPTRNGTDVTNTTHNADDCLTLLSVYKEQGIKRTLSTPTKIYAPEGTFEVTDMPNETLNASRRVDLNTEEQDTSSEAAEQDKALAEKTEYHL